jgi:hypothetical protein
MEAFHAPGIARQTPPIAKGRYGRARSKKVAPDFTVSIRPGTPALLVLDEAAIPSI